jgi:DNA-binding PadR family transcriptional regulator
MAIKEQIRRGSTEILLLKLLAERPMYGYEISQELAQRSDGYFEMKEGLLYPTLHRMQQNGWLRSEWRQAEGRRRKYYHLSAAGRDVLAEQTGEWLDFMSQLRAVLGLDA